MAQSLFDSIVDNSTYLAVQSLLDTHGLHEGSSQHATQGEVDEEDVFQCGKCKKQFNSLSLFVNHKQSCTGHHNGSQQNSDSLLMHRQDQSLSTAISLSHLTNSMVIGDDIMTLNFDHNSGMHVQTSGIQNNPFLSSAQMAPQTDISCANHSANHYSISNQLQLHPVTLMQMPGNTSGHAVAHGSNMIAFLVDSNGDHTLQQHSDSHVGEGLRAADPLSMDQSGSEKKARRSELKRLLACQFCDKTFNKKFDLQQHVRAHTGEKPFQCVVCGRAFSQKSNVKKHMQTHKVWPSCNSGTLPPPAPPQLIVVQDNKATDQMSTDSQGTAHKDTEGAKEAVKFHFLVDDSYVCPYCPSGVKFPTHYKLRSHLLQHKSQQVYKCVVKLCGQTFPDLDSYVEHMRTHESEMIYRCHICNKQFSSLGDLGTHQFSHSTCSQDTDEPRKSKRHWCFKCTKCSNLYSTPEALEHHMTSTNHEFPCPYCIKTFTCERYLRRHLPFHSGTSSLNCTICSKRFKTDYYLKLHMRIHTGEKPYSCERCSKQFNRRDKLRRHMLTHDETKKFKCPFKDVTGCDREFCRNDKLKEHLLKHTTFGTVSKNASKLPDLSYALQAARLGRSAARQAETADGLTCRFCLHCRFQSAEQLAEHESMCEQVPRLTCKKCLLTFNRRETLVTHDCQHDTSIVSQQYRTLKTPIFKRKRKGARPRGRPPKVHCGPPAPTRPKRKPGRPRKYQPPIQEDIPTQQSKPQASGDAESCDNSPALTTDHSSYSSIEIHRVNRVGEQLACLNGNEAIKPADSSLNPDKFVFVEFPLHTAFSLLDQDDCSDKLQSSS